MVYEYYNGPQLLFKFKSCPGSEVVYLQVVGRYCIQSIHKRAYCAVLGGICLDDSIFLLFVNTLTGVVQHLYRYRNKNVEYASVQRITLLTIYVSFRTYALTMSVLVLCMNGKVQYCFCIFGENRYSNTTIVYSHMYSI